ncbi:MAG: rRNA maturation RNase YbeY [bacterium]|nr:rRNA maturation RNase YbeY [bacterium]MCP5071195.1 rRNA maturation RNase YbeY [bacterium]
MPVHVSGPPPEVNGPVFDADGFAHQAERLLKALEVPDAELSISLVDDRAMAAMNQRFRGREGPTDVLSFSLLEGEHAEHRGGMLGDVVLGLEVADRQAASLGHSLDEELLRLLIHGALHLLGFDHGLDHEAHVMQERERELRVQLA